MTTIDVHTSPLQAAREWRGIGLVAAALTCGLPVTQAEALESGDLDAFDSVDEMIAAAVVYGASLGIGRDEAVALLDRTVSGSAVEVSLPDVPTDAPVPGGFSTAVRERSARIADRGSDVTPAHVVVEPELPVADRVFDEPVAPSALSTRMPDVPGGPTPEQAVAASAEIHLDHTFGPEAPWDRVGHTGELEAWAAEDDDALEPRYRADGVVTRIGATCRSGLERVVGTDRSDQFADWFARTADRVREATRGGRERLRASEHATLIVAIGGGAVLIALVVAIGGALGSEEPPAGPGPADRGAATAKVETAATPAAAKKAEAAAPVAMLPPAQLRLNVFNAGAQKGKAREIADTLKGLGYRIGEVTNAKGDYVANTVIHPKGMEREAKLIARRVGITRLQVAPGSSKVFTIVVR